MAFGPIIPAAGGGGGGGGGTAPLVLTQDTDSIAGMGNETVDFEVGDATTHVLITHAYIQRIDGEAQSAAATIIGNGVTTPPVFATPFSGGVDVGAGIPVLGPQGPDHNSDQRRYPISAVAHDGTLQLFVSNKDNTNAGVFRLTLHLIVCQ